MFIKKIYQAQKFKKVGEFKMAVETFLPIEKYKSEKLKKCFIL
jgi:hypothetical protein